MKKHDTTIALVASKETHISNSTKIESVFESTIENRSTKNVKSKKSIEKDYEYVIEIKLITIIACITLMTFLIMLDQFIIVTID